MVARKQLGNWGEEQVAQWYLGRGFEILDRNWRPQGAGVRGELDLVCSLGRLLVVCEVKTRSSDAFGSAFDAITLTKQKQLRLLTGLYMQAMRKSASPLPTSNVRIDIASVTPKGISVLEAAC